MRKRSDLGAPLGAVLALAGTLGFVQFGLFFADLSGAGALARRLIAASALAAVSGAVLGRLRPREAVRMSLVSVWGALLWGSALRLMRADAWIEVLAIPAAMATLCGGLAGAWERRRRGARGPAPPSAPPTGTGG